MQNNCFTGNADIAAFFYSLKNRTGKGFKPNIPETLYSKGFYKNEDHRAPGKIAMSFAETPCSIGFTAHLYKKIFFKKNFVPVKNLLYLLHTKFQKKPTMNKEELIAKISDDAGVTKTQSNDSLDSFVEAVTKTLKCGG